MNDNGYLVDVDNISFHEGRGEVESIVEQAPVWGSVLKHW